jgi:hypothetical protein
VGGRFVATQRAQHDLINVSAYDLAHVGQIRRSFAGDDLILKVGGGTIHLVDCRDAQHGPAVISKDIFI